MFKKLDDLQGKPVSVLKGSHYWLGPTFVFFNMVAPFLQIWSKKDTAVGTNANVCKF